MNQPEAPKVRFRAPADPAAKPCGLAEVLKAIHGRDEKYWSGGTGVAVLHSRTGDGRLTLAFRPAYGFFLTAYKTAGDDSASHVASTNSDFETVTELRVGERTMTVPRAFFVAPLRAIQVAEQFARDGARSKAVNWIEMPGRAPGN